MPEQSTYTRCPAMFSRLGRCDLPEHHTSLHATNAGAGWSDPEALSCMEAGDIVTTIPGDVWEAVFKAGTSGDVHTVLTRTRRAEG